MIDIEPEHNLLLTFDFCVDWFKNCAQLTLFMGMLCIKICPVSVCLSLWNASRKASEKYIEGYPEVWLVELTPNESLSWSDMVT